MEGPARELSEAPRWATTGVGSRLREPGVATINARELSRGFGCHAEGEDFADANCWLDRPRRSGFAWPQD
ncbi:MAG: hypothetical protein SFV23_20155 [Planctomycetaceae bacterium]|nr:hypothetical protein [Planctomycetaceae bacterium]